MAATFPCPHCGAEYPVKPVLVGRAVRCTNCRNAFRLREDGIAEPVNMGGGDDGAQQESTTTQQGTPDDQPPARDSLADAANAAAAALGATAADPAPPSDRSASERRAQEQAQEQAKANKQRETMRRTMASTLSDAAKEAMNAEAVKRETTRSRRQAVSGKVGDVGPAMLTGQGEREARNMHQWVLGLAIGGILVALFVWMWASESATKAALRNYAQRQAGDASQRDRLETLRSRALLYDADIPVILNLNRAEPGSQRSYSIAPARSTLMQLADAPLPPADDLTRKLQAGGLANEAAAIVARLLLGRTSSTSNENWIRDRLLAGDLPAAIETCSFHGTDGVLLTGNTQRIPIGSYYGRLLRFAGWPPLEGGPDPAAWRVFEVEAK